jgi:hypothetical protein
VDDPTNFHGGLYRADTIQGHYQNDSLRGAQVSPASEAALERRTSPTPRLAALSAPPRERNGAVLMSALR